MPGVTEFFGRAADVVVTFEDHVLPGGYGSSVLELFNEKRITTPVVLHRLARPVHRARQLGGSLAGEIRPDRGQRGRAGQ